ncbi:hypothetical protein Btru_009650 [Bulinus truncatus]|nr:hypothetical protein Btru_009650 [Bulinus truncatus]
MAAVAMQDYNLGCSGHAGLEPWLLWPYRTTILAANHGCCGHGCCGHAGLESWLLWPWMLWSWMLWPCRTRIMAAVAMQDYNLGCCGHAGLEPWLLWPYRTTILADVAMQD